MDAPYDILKNENLSQNYFKITINLPAIPIPRPGQFYHIRCSTSTDPLLRRPFSLHRWMEGGNSLQIEILYRVVGKGTEWLSKKQKGESLDILGPFGNGFIIEEDVDHLLLVARGIGIAPLYAVAEEALRKDGRKKIFILMGARFKERVFYEEECKKIGEVFLYTDDGSQGFHGKGPELLSHLLRNKKLPEPLSLYACGPGSMLRELAEIGKKFGIPGQLALEDHLGCGFGACLSCVCPLKPQSIRRNDDWEKPALQWSEDRTHAYSLICRDGPIYDIYEVNWEEWLA
ncbi:MAG: hypothetical protein A2W09_07520 [Deltaproteobacteria bacterium RBG_16_50_11]|nr:MAG: hypothetical protein A2W09_07520 [Deltaproteobacteria bacterium RBG_16_50_11]